MSEALRPSQVFGRRVRDARKRLGWTQEQLADRLTEIGHLTERTAVARIEKGQRFAALDTALAMSAALSVPVVHLLTPLEDEADVAITPSLTVPAAAARDWIRGLGLLPGVDLLDVWRHLPESEQRKALGHVAEDAEENPLAAALMGLYDPDERMAAIAWAARQRRKEEDNG